MCQVVSTDKRNTKFPITNCTSFSVKEPLKKTVSGRLFTVLVLLRFPAIAGIQDHFLMKSL